MPSPAFLQSVAASHASLAQLWSADSLGQGEASVVGTGHAALDAELPGGGWPVGALIEVLQPGPAQHVWQLLLPALAERLRHSRGPVVLVGAPHVPFGPALAASGVAGDRLLWVRDGGTGGAGDSGGVGPAAREAPRHPQPSFEGGDLGWRPRPPRQLPGAPKSASAAWACEQALRCCEVAAVLAWLPQVRQSDLRRLHLAAQQHDNLLFALRPLAALHESTPARLRVVVEAAAAPPGRVAAGGEDRLSIGIAKRRGPPLAAPLQLAAWPARLAALLQAAPQRMQAGVAQVQVAAQMQTQTQAQLQTQRQAQTEAQEPAQAARAVHALRAVALAASHGQPAAFLAPRPVGPIRTRPFAAAPADSSTDLAAAGFDGCEPLAGWPGHPLAPAALVSEVRHALDRPAAA